MKKDTKKVMRVLLAEYPYSRPFDASSAFYALSNSTGCKSMDPDHKVLTLSDGKTVSQVTSEDETRILLWLEIPEDSEYTTAVI